MSRTTLRPSLAALSLIAALFVALVAPAGAACHTGDRTCFDAGDLDAQVGEP